MSNLPSFRVINGLTQARASESSDTLLAMNKCAVLRSDSQSEPVNGAALMANSTQSFPSNRGASGPLMARSKGTPLEPQAIVSAALMESIHASHPAEFFNGGSILRVDNPSAVFFQSRRISSCC
jgi:hypothetical protein